MDTRLAQYSPEDVIIAIAMMHTISGYVAGSFVSIEKATPTFTERETADGVVSRVLNPSKLYVLRLTLAQHAESNQVLSWIHNADRITGGRAKFPLTLKDKNGSSVLFAAEAWIRTVPNSSFSEGIESRVWEIVCAGAVNHVGSNYGDSSLLDDFVSLGGGLLGSIV